DQNDVEVKKQSTCVHALLSVRAMLRRVAVVGGGAAGLCAAKHILSRPGSFAPPVVFELSDSIGGTWCYDGRAGTDDNGRPIHSSMYRDLQTNLPKEVMMFPDFPFDPRLSSFLPHQEVQGYLESYCQSHHIRPHVRFNTTVEKVKPVVVTTEGEAARTTWEVTSSDSSGGQKTESFNSVFVCSGHYSDPYIPDIPGIEHFKGEVLHSHAYRCAEPFSGRSVVVLGAKASGLDISIELAKVGAQVTDNKRALLGRLQLLRTPDWRSAARRTEGKRKRCARKQKRGKRGGLLARLKANAGRPPIPSLFLSNVRSLDNKLDLLRLRLGASPTTCRTQPSRSTAGFSSVRTATSGRGKPAGADYAFYVNKDWCTNCTLVNSQLLRGDRAHDCKVPATLSAPSLQHKHPEAFYVVAGDFNHVNLTDTLPKFYQHVTIPTRGNNTLDRVYTNKRDAYRAVPHPHLGFSDHISIMLLPAYRPLLRHTPKQRTITVWPSDAVPALQDCFQRTDWQIFREAAVREGEVDLEDYTSAVLGYISKCTEDVTSTRTVTEYPNQKPWLNAEVRSLLKARDAAFSVLRERLVMAHIKDCVDVTVDPHQYAYRKNRSTEDAISSVVHTALTHLENKDSYVRLLFVDFTSAFNTIIPQTLVQKLTTLGLSFTLCNWVLDFLTDRPQSVRIHDFSSSSISLSTGSPQGCVLSPLLFTLLTLTHDCSAIHPSCLIVKFADDTAVVGRIANNDESDYRQEVEHLEGWCSRQNNLCINVKKTKEMIVDFRRGRHLPSPLYIGGTAVEVVSSFRYLGVHISDDLTWSKNTSCSMCGGERPVLLHHRVARQLLGGREEGSAEGGEGCTEDCGMQSTHHHGHLHFQMQETKQASCIMKDPTHTAHELFVPLPSGRRLRSIKSRTTRLRNSFFPEAVILSDLSHGRPRFTFPLPSGIKQSSPVVAVEDNGSFRFQDGSVGWAEVLLFCTGYNFRFPFLDGAELGLEIQDQLVSPLYRLMMPPAFPSLFFIGISKMICPFPNFNCQVQFALAVLDGSVILPSAVQMEDEVRREQQEKLERGVQQHHLLTMQQEQWEYCRTLARTANFPPLPPVVQSLYEEVWRQRQIHPENYRRLNYRLSSDTQWELIENLSIVSSSTQNNMKQYPALLSSSLVNFWISFLVHHTLFSVFYKETST
ncbi:hypothetical protein L3Q82_022606, partial [Scortum barcoo]